MPVATTLNVVEEPAQTLWLKGCVVIDGPAAIVTVKELPLLVQPAAVATVRVPVYVPAATPAGIENVMGLEGSAWLPVFTRPAASAAAFHTIL